MRELIYKVKPVVPPAIWRGITSPYWWWYNRARHQVASWTDSRLRSSQQRVFRFKDFHHGDRCFIIGNGPSLNKMDLAPLQNEITFGMNRIYLLFDEWGYSINYYVAINDLVIEQCASDIEELSMPRFIGWRGRRWMKGEDVYFLDTDYTPPEAFTTDIGKRVFEGSTVTFVAMQIAFFMGFSEVILIGVDHSFSTQGAPNETVVSQGDDQNHFSTDYFGKGFTWQLPDLEASERAYKLADTAYKSADRRILDATIGGSLTIFPKVDYSTLF